MKKLLTALTLAAAPLLAQAGEFTLTSPDLKPGEKIAGQFVFKGFGCEGGNLSPALKWKNPPKDTQSFALTVYDPDAPTGSGWWHWVAYNIPAKTKGLPQGAGTAQGDKLPAGTVQGRTDFGAPGYGGPCPPVGHGDHHYTFAIYALKVPKLELPADATAAMVGYMINANKIGEAKFTSLYSR